MAVKGFFFSLFLTSATRVPGTYTQQRYLRQSWSFFRLATTVTSVRHNVPLSNACIHRPGERQVSRVEEFLAEAWQSFRSEPRARPALPPTSSPPLPLAATQRSPGQQQSSPGPRSQHLNAESFMTPPAPAVSEPSPSGRAVARDALGGGGGSGGVPPRLEAVSAMVESVAVVGAAEYLQWLGDMSNMLVHEQWRKEVGRSAYFISGSAPIARGRKEGGCHIL